MFSTVNSVKEYTNADVTIDLIKRAQGVVEVFVGKDEIDVTNPNDLLILDKMTAYQSAYMLNNEEIVFQQIASLSTGSGDSIQNYDPKMSAPFMAPLAVMASSGLTFKRGRSIRTGRIFQLGPKLDWTKY
jgi:hypothetical protein